MRYDPELLLRTSAANRARFAARSNRGMRLHDAPRRTCLLQSPPLVHAPPSAGALAHLHSVTSAARANVRSVDSEAPSTKSSPSMTSKSSPSSAHATSVASLRGLRSDAIERRRRIHGLHLSHGDRCAADADSVVIEGDRGKDKSQVILPFAASLPRSTSSMIASTLECTPSQGGAPNSWEGPLRRQRRDTLMTRNHSGREAVSIPVCGPRERASGRTTELHPSAHPPTRRRSRTIPNPDRTPWR